MTLTDLEAEDVPVEVLRHLTQLRAALRRLDSATHDADEQMELVALMDSERLTRSLQTELEVLRTVLLKRGGERLDHLREVLAVVTVGLGADAVSCGLSVSGGVHQVEVVGHEDSSALVADEVKTRRCDVHTVEETPDAAGVSAPVASGPTREESVPGVRMHPVLTPSDVRVMFAGDHPDGLPHLPDVPFDPSVVAVVTVTEGLVGDLARGEQRVDLGMQALGHETPLLLSPTSWNLDRSMPRR